MPKNELGYYGNAVTIYVIVCNPIPPLDLVYFITIDSRSNEYVMPATKCTVMAFIMKRRTALIHITYTSLLCLFVYLI